MPDVASITPASNSSAIVLSSSLGSHAMASRLSATSFNRGCCAKLTAESRLLSTLPQQASFADSHTDSESETTAHLLFNHIHVLANDGATSNLHQTQTKSVCYSDVLQLSDAPLGLRPMCHKKDSLFAGAENGLTGV